MSDPARQPAPRRLDPALVVEALLCLSLIVIFALMYAETYEWEIEAGLFPRVIAGLGVLSAAAYLIQIVWQRVSGRGGAGGRILDIAWAKVDGDAREIKRTALGVIAWALAFWAGIWLLGFHIAAPVYLYGQLVIYGAVRKWIAALAAGGCLAVIILVYDRLAETTWNDPLLFDILAGFS
ncbi:MAG: hypothetical protein OEO83_13330 [Alphaproteobacteria bacterium]|nr:hypothetical protein [Alphaproteobacteria bacterium]